MSKTKVVTGGLDQTGSFDFTSGVTLGDNLLFDASSKGVYLGVTSATAANLLDDYEEGTWTPDLQFGGAKVGILYSALDGHYIKVGNKVTVSAVLELSSKGSSSGSLEIYGLPFTVADTLAGTSLDNHGFVGFYDNVASSAVYNMGVATPASSTKMYLYHASSSGGSMSGNMDNGDVNDNFSIRLSAVYFTS